MICDSCNEKQANVFFTQIINGQVKKVNLCEECSKKKGVTDSTSFALADMLLGLGKDEPAAAPRSKAVDEISCPACGFTHSDFKKSGRLGCGRCYELFRHDIESLLKNIHKGVRHVGKIPAHAAAATATTAKLDELKSALGRAIEDEHFEEAARLRDEINKIAAAR